MSFVIYEGAKCPRPIARITRIGDEPVEYYDSDSILGMLNPKWSHKIPGVIVKSIGDKPVEYDPSFFSSRNIISVGDEPVVYSSCDGHMAWIGDKEVITSSFWSGHNRIITVGGKPVYYNALPKDQYEKYYQVGICGSVLVTLIAVDIFVAFVMISNRYK